jgi:anaerobic ribonucleoside-triphosphate reductase activating protein
MNKLLNVNTLYHNLHTVHPLANASILHLQGCRKGRTNPCPGCANRALWGDEPNWLVDPVEFVKTVISHAAAPALSISGGEPLDQYELLCHFLETLRKADFSILLYTGFEFEKVQLKFSPVLDLVDYIIAGPYQEQNRIKGVPFTSSSNQEIHCRTVQARRTLEAYNRVGEFEVVINKSDLSAVELGVI